MLEFLSNKVEVQKACNFIKKILQHCCFPLNIAKFLRAPNLRNICEWLFLDFSTDLGTGSKVSKYGVFSGRYFSDSSLSFCVIYNCYVFKEISVDHEKRGKGTREYRENIKFYKLRCEFFSV